MRWEALILEAMLGLTWKPIWPRRENRRFIDNYNLIDHQMCDVCENKTNMIYLFDSKHLRWQFGSVGKSTEIVRNPK